MAGAFVPALLNRTSSRPKVSRVLANSARTESGLVTSVGTLSILPPVADADAAVRANGSARRPASTTEYPADWSARATARPMPLPAPVTREILPLSVISQLSFILIREKRITGSFFWTPPPEPVTLAPRAHERGPMNILHDE